MLSFLLRTRTLQHHQALRSKHLENTRPLRTMAPTRLKAKDKGRESGRYPEEASQDPDSDDSTPEKDKTEEKLEKLLFGDEAGFLEGLKPRSADRYLAVRTASGEEDVDLGTGEDPEAIADEDVRANPLSRTQNADKIVFRSFSFSTPVQMLCRMTGAKHKEPAVMRTPVGNRSG
jgi:hypothetical protein